MMMAIELDKPFCFGVVRIVVNSQAFLYKISIYFYFTLNYNTVIPFFEGLWDHISDFIKCNKVAKLVKNYINATMLHKIF